MRSGELEEQRKLSQPFGEVEIGETPPFRLHLELGLVAQLHGRPEGAFFGTEQGQSPDGPSHVRRGKVPACRDDGNCPSTLLGSTHLGRK